MTRDVLVEALSDLGDMGFAAVFKNPDGVLVLASRRRRSWDLPSQCRGCFGPPGVFVASCRFTFEAASR
jgi:hypothetical protein